MRLSLIHVHADCTKVTGLECVDEVGGVDECSSAGVHNHKACLSDKG